MKRNEISLLDRLIIRIFYLNLQNSMRRPILFLSLALSLSLFAQDAFRSMTVEGKTWNVFTKYANYGNRWESGTTKYFIKGDTVINGMDCKGLYKEERGIPVLEGYLYEEGLRVFHIHVDIWNGWMYMGAPHLLYDFGLNPGEETVVYPLDYRIGETVRALSVDTVYVGDVPLRRLRIASDNSKYYDKVDCCWVQGMGNPRDLLDPTVCRKVLDHYLESCTLDGDTLFTYEDFGVVGNYFTETDRLPYHLMLKEGKTWNYTYVHYDDIDEPPYHVESTWNMAYVLRGDTVIGGERAMKMYRDSKGVTTYIGAWVEDGMRVYVVPAAKEVKQLKYDFTIPVGHERYIEDDPYCLMYLNKVDTIELNGIMFNRFNFNLYDDGIEAYDWIEGIGGFDGILHPDPYTMRTCVCDYAKFVSCYEDGKQIYPEVELADSIGRVTTPSMGNAIYDLQGRRVNTPQRGGLYIQGGKKFIFR